MKYENELALAALIVALVALVGAILQILAQYLATTEGYRKCGRSVIGEWARFTRRQFKIREFRYEVLFATPHITCVQLRPHQDVSDADPDLVDLGYAVSSHDHDWPLKSLDTRGKPAPAESRSRFFLDRKVWMQLVRSIMAKTPHPSTDEAKLTQMHASLVDAFAQRLDHNKIENEKASWVKLIQAMQYTLEFRKKMKASLREPEQTDFCVRPAVRASYKSWDFIPPDITRPYATTTVSALATLVQMLGMTWDRFRPEDGELVASSENMQISSYEVRTLGTVVRLSTSADFMSAIRQLTWPTWRESYATTMLGFGLIPEKERSFSKTYLADGLCFGTAEDISAAIGQMEWYWGPDRFSRETRPSATTPILNVSEDILGLVAMDLLGILASTPGSQYGNGGYLLRPSKFHGRCNWLIWSDFFREAQEVRDILDPRDSKPLFQSGWRADRVGKVFRVMLDGEDTDPRVKIDRYRSVGPDLNSLHAIDEQISDGWIGDESLADKYLSSHGSFMSVIGLHVHTLTKEFPKHSYIATGTNPVLDVGAGPNVQPSPNHSQIMHVLFSGIRDQAGKSIKGAEQAILWTCLIYRALCFHRLFKFYGKPNAVPLRYRNDQTIIHIE